MDVGNSLQVVVAAAMACAVTGVTTPWVAKLALVVGAVDLPGPRKRHTQPTPRLGGVSVIAGIVAGIGATATLAALRNDLLAEWSTGVGALIAAAGCIFLLGLLADVRRVPAAAKLVVQLGAAVLLVTQTQGWTFGAIGLPGGWTYELGAWSIPFTVLWIVGICNAINLTDGMDGLATGVTGIVAGGLAGYALIVGADTVALFAAGIAGASAGFLIHNRAPARVFLGDAGALTLGFLLAALSVRAAQQAPSSIAIVPFLMLGVPAIDTIMVAVARFRRASGLGPRSRMARILRADRLHLHHLLRQGVTDGPRVVFQVHMAVLLATIAALVVAVFRAPTLGFALLAVQLVLLVLVRVSFEHEQADETLLTRLGESFATIRAPASRAAGLSDASNGSSAVSGPDDRVPRPRPEPGARAHGSPPPDSGAVRGVRPAKPSSQPH